MIIQLLGFQQTNTIMTLYILIIKVGFYIKLFLILERETFVMFNNSCLVDISPSSQISRIKEEAYVLGWYLPYEKVLGARQTHLPDYSRTKSNFHGRGGPQVSQSIITAQQGAGDGTLWVSGKWCSEDLSCYHYALLHQAQATTQSSHLVTLGDCKYMVWTN